MTAARSPGASMFRARIYQSQRDVLLAASDEELVGRTLSFGKIQVDITPAFYGSDSVTERELVEMLQQCTVANLMGPRTVTLARRLGLVRDGNVLDIDGVPHAQLARMR